MGICLGGSFKVGPKQRASKCKDDVPRFSAADGLVSANLYAQFAGRGNANAGNFARGSSTLFFLEGSMSLQDELTAGHSPAITPGAVRLLWNCA